MKLQEPQRQQRVSKKLLHGETTCEIERKFRLLTEPDCLKNARIIEMRIAYARLEDVPSGLMRLKKTGEDYIFSVSDGVNSTKFLLPKEFAKAILKGKKFRVRESATVDGIRWELTIKTGSGLIRNEWQCNEIPRWLFEFVQTHSYTRGAKQRFVSEQVGEDGEVRLLEIDRFACGILVCEVEFPDEEAALSYQGPVGIGAWFDVTGKKAYGSSRMITASEAPKDYCLKELPQNRCCSCAN